MLEDCRSVRSQPIFYQSSKPIENTIGCARIDTLTPSVKQFYLPRLATYFAGLAVRSSIHALPPSNDHLLTRASPPYPKETSTLEDFRHYLTAAVDRAVHGHEFVAVALSGGLASAAIAEAASHVCSKTGRRLVIVTLGVTDDRGMSVSQRATALINTLRIKAPHLTISAHPSRWPLPEWDPIGPLNAPWPRFRTGIAITARDAGATVLLDGRGASQLLTATRHLTSRLMRGRRWTEITTYRRDMAMPAIMELSAASAPLRWAYGRQLCKALILSEAPDTARILTEEYRVTANTWQNNFLTEFANGAAIKMSGWAQAELMYHAMLIDRPSPAIGSIIEASPYLDSDFAKYAFDLPLRARYSAKQPSEYLRRNAILADLLPATKQLFAKLGEPTCNLSRARYWRVVDRDAPLLVKTGVLSPNWRRQCPPDAYPVVTNCEQWASEALGRGYVMNAI